MRVFDCYGFNIIDKVAFKETRPYLDKMLSELGYGYKNLMFSLEGSIYRTALVDKVLAKYPALQKYFFYDNTFGVKEPYISSITENWREGKIYADREDWNDISEVFSKIPRPFNFAPAKLFLSGINWYPDSDDSLALDYSRSQGRYPTPDAFIFNCIQQWREYDDGRKWNTVGVNIEVTAEPEPRDSKGIIERLIPYLGEPTSSTRVCIFPQEELLRLQSLEKSHRERLDRIAKDELPSPLPWERTIDDSGVWIIDAPIRHIADKPTLNAAFAGTGFERHTENTPSWLKLYACTDSHGFLYKAYVQKLSSGTEFRFDLDVSGYNFEVGLFSKDYHVTREGESLEILRQFAQLCVKIRDEYSAELAKDFGDTPAWYRENNNMLW